MDEDGARKALVAGAIVLGLSSVGAGALIALAGDEEERPGPGRTPSPTATRSRSPSESPEPRTGSPAATPTESPILEDGRHFVFVTDAARLQDGTTTITFDLAYFYPGERAEREAAERGDEVVDDHYIVNENPRLRRLPLAGIVRVEYVPESLCCELQTGNVDAWVESVLGTSPTDYPGTDVPWWLTVEGGAITRIEQQYLP